MLHRTRETNPPDYAHAEEDTDLILGKGGWYAYAPALTWKVELFFLIRWEIFSYKTICRLSHRLSEKALRSWKKPSEELLLYLPSRVLKNQI